MVNERSTVDDPSAGEPARGRVAILLRIVDHLSAHGSHAVTLRGLAAATGTSHRMLIYHFGSLEGVLQAVVAEVESRQQAALRDLAAEPTAALVDIAAGLWDRLSGAELRALERLFFDMYVRALGEGAGSASAAMVGPMLTAAKQSLTDHGVDPALARPLSRLGLAVTRGLLLDLLATEDVEGVDEAMQLYLSWLRALE